MSSGHIRIVKVGFNTTPKPPEPEMVKAPKPKPKKDHWTKRVLKKVVMAPIFLLLIPLTPKPIQTMLHWLKNRFGEPSTYQGLTTMLGAVGFVISPEAWEAIVALVAGIVGMIQFIKEEKKVIEKK